MSKATERQTQKQEEEELRKNPIHLFRCESCKDSPEMVFEEFKHHLFTVHQLKADELKGNKQMIMHMDGARWFSSTYQWNLQNGIKATEFVKMARSKGDPMRYEED